MKHQEPKHTETTQEGQTPDEQATENASPSIEDLQTELKSMHDQWLRAVAEAENTRRRAQKEKEEAQKYALTSFARDLLSVSDNFTRALESISNKGDLPETLSPFVSGIEMTHKELHGILDRHGIRAVNPLNEKFDPNFHQAMFEVESAEVSPGTVMQVLQIGYVIHDRLLRPALVGVSKAPSTPLPGVRTSA